MNKTELIDAIARGSNVTKADASRVLETFTVTIADALAKGEDVSIIGFGTFVVSERAERQGRNPQTGATIQIPKRRVVNFRSGKGLKEQLQK